MNHLLILGTILIIFGILLIILSLSSKKVKSDGGFVAFIGPIPIVGATSKQLLFIMLIFSIIVLLIFLYFQKF